MPDGEPIQIQLLGQFVVQQGEARVEPADWTRRKAAALLQRVAVEGQLLKDQAIDFLWPESARNAGANNLYRTLHSLRKTLDRELGEGAAEATISYQDGVVSLRDGLWIDVHAFTEAARSEDPDSLEEALELYQGELLPNARYDEWTLPQRDDLHQTFREASLSLAEHYSSAGKYGDAIELLTPLLRHDRADEVVHRELMRCYAGAGRRHDALRQYQTCVERLREDIGVDPAPPTRELYQAILEGTFPTERARTSGTRGTFPTALTAVNRMKGPLVGRDSELAQLDEALAAVDKGEGSTWLVEGFAGIGKSHMAHEVLSRAADKGYRVLLGSAHEEEGQLPYHPFVEAFDRWVGGKEGPQSHPLSTAKLTSEGEQIDDALALYRAVASFLSADGQQPWVLLVDDLHEADEGSLQLFHYLARQTKHLPGLLLATFRPGEDAPGTTFAALINSLYRERLGGRLKLAPLDKAGVAELLEHELKTPPADDLVRAVYEISEGNPFFTQEITRTVREKGLLQEQDERISIRRESLTDQVPRQLVDLIKGRIRDLGTEVEKVLTPAAVLGRDFRFEPLHEMIERSDAELLDALDVALESDLVQETDAGYRFRHGLIRQALYDSLSRARRQRLHRRAAQVLQTQEDAGEETMLARVEALAHHYLRSDQRRQAIEYLVQAGEKAARLYAFDLAVEHCERALELMDELNIPDPEQRFDLLLSIEGYHGLLADTPQAVEAGQRALQVGDEDWEPTPEQRALVRRRSAIRLITAGRLEQAEAALEAALDQLDGRAESSEYGRVLYNLAQLRWHQNRYRDAYQIAEQSLDIAERLGDRESIARAFEMLALCCHSLGEWQQGVAFEEQRASVSGSDIDVGSAFDVHL